MFKIHWKNKSFVATRQLSFPWLMLSSLKVSLVGDQIRVVFESKGKLPTARGKHVCTKTDLLAAEVSRSFDLGIFQSKLTFANCT